MFDHSNPVCGLIYRRTLAAWLFIALIILTAGCQASNHDASPSPTDTREPAKTPAAAYDFGSLVVSLRTGAIWLLVGKETPRLLAYGRDATLSPDGCRALFVQDSVTPPPTPEYWIINIDDPAPSLLLSPQDSGAVYGLAWSPDSRSLAVTNGSSAASGKTMYTGNLWLVDVSDGDVTHLAGSGAGVPRFSPDGEWIATSTPEIGWSHGTVGLWRVEDKSGQTLFDPLMYQYLKWADDSSGFALALQRHGDAGLELWWVPVDDVPMQLGYLPNATYAAWQPGVERLAYRPSSLVIEDPEHHAVHISHSLHLVDRDGSGDVEVPGSEGMWTGPWSPNGRWLLTVDRDGHTYIVDTDIMHTPLLLNVGRVHRWLDSAHYLASTYHAGGTELYRCMPPETCFSLGQLDGEIQRLDYTSKLCQP